MYNTLFPFFLFLFCVSIFRAFVFSRGKKQQQEKESYVYREMEANFSRKKPIPEELFRHPDQTMLPIQEYKGWEDDKTVEKLKNAQDTALRKSKLKMLSIYPPLPNIELKKAYGTANLQNLIQYEENYNDYIHALNRWGEELIKNSQLGEAEQVLLAAAAMESNVSKTYMLLTDIYTANNGKDKLKALIHRIDSIESIINEPALYEKIMNYIGNVADFD